MAIYVQYGKVGKPILYSTLPTASADLNGVIGQVGDKVYQCDGTQWVALASPANLQDKSVTITQNGTTEITADSGYGGMSKATIITNVPSTAQSLNTIAGVMSVNFSGFVENDYQLFITKMREVLSTITNAGAKLYKLAFDTTNSTLIYEETTAENFPMNSSKTYNPDIVGGSIILGIDTSLYTQLKTLLTQIGATFTDPFVYLSGIGYPSWKIESENHVVNIYIGGLLGSEKETSTTDDFVLRISDGEGSLKLSSSVSIGFNSAPYMSINRVD